MILTHRWTSLSSTALHLQLNVNPQPTRNFTLSSLGSWISFYQSHVQEEGSEGQRELQEPKGVSEQRQDGEGSGRRRRSVLGSGLSEQTVYQQQRRVLRHRFQGEQSWLSNVSRNARAGVPTPGKLSCQSEKARATSPSTCKLTN